MCTTKLVDNMLLEDTEPSEDKTIPDSNVMIKKCLWILLDAKHSHIAQMAVPLLLHCITLPCGVGTFWQIMQYEFLNDDWRVRFTAVEKATLIARFLDSTPLKKECSLQATLANLFCYLINSMDDDSAYVAQKATLYLGTIHDSAAKSLLLCMETQFNMMIVDRPLILQSLYHLHNCLSDRHILTWEFFLNRFDTLFIEAQIIFGREEEGHTVRGTSNILYKSHLNKDLDKYQNK
ncbi:protein unc-79 homolog [Copidosoma floridanum]|uniref:protein unc-79 homolog n=1 Tax=Copidosoma floridanum TaxID=29053 RepID=UPI0006C94CF4|nr:protein unc-79 homolog [Copidosoma floridanum]